MPSKLLILFNSSSSTERQSIFSIYFISPYATELDVSQNTALTELVCLNNQLTDLDLSQNTTLNALFCERNQLTELDISKNTALYQLLTLVDKNVKIYR